MSAILTANPVVYKSEPRQVVKRGFLIVRFLTTKPTEKKEGSRMILVVRREIDAVYCTEYANIHRVLDEISPETDLDNLEVYEVSNKIELEKVVKVKEDEWPSN